MKSNLEGLKAAYADSLLGGSAHTQFIALSHNLTPALISAAEILTKILNAHESGNNGAYMGEATLCPYFAKAAKSVLNDLGVKTYVASE